MLDWLRLFLFQMNLRKACPFCHKDSLQQVGLGSMEGTYYSCTTADCHYNESPWSFSERVMVSLADFCTCIFLLVVMLPLLLIAAVFATVIEVKENPGTSLFKFLALGIVWWIIFRIVGF